MTVKNALYILIQLTWGLPQNIIGAVIWLAVNLKEPKRKRFVFHGSPVTVWKLHSSLGIGLFIFVSEYGMREEVLVHEYGHTVQSLILGPFFLPVIGLPSLLWAGMPVFARMRMKKGIKYCSFYPEKWANHEGKRKTGHNGIKY